DALVAAVLPCTIATLYGVCNIFIPARIAAEGSSGVLSCLWMCQRPVPSNHTKSVKVPPVSTPARVLFCIAGLFISNTGRGTTSQCPVSHRPKGGGIRVQE